VERPGQNHLAVNCGRLAQALDHLARAGEPDRQSETVFDRLQRARQRGHAMLVVPLLQKHNGEGFHDAAPTAWGKSMVWPNTPNTQIR